MRISDWSSDVCSSDLAGDEDRAAGEVVGAVQEPPRLRGGAPTVGMLIGALHACPCFGSDVGSADAADPRGMGIDALYDDAGFAHFATRVQHARRLRMSCRPNRRRSSLVAVRRSEERRVGKECGSTVWSRWAPDT